MDDVESSSERLIAETRREFPGFRLVPKRASRLARAIDLALRVITFGAQRRFLTHYHTVLFDVLYLPDSWDATPDTDRVITLRHERVHMRQRRRYGDLLFAFLYLVPFFPVGLAYGRAHLEWEAYAETLRATAELAGIEAARSPELRERIVRQFTGAAYVWMWPFPRMVLRWHARALDAIARELESSATPPSAGER
jgi:hypothetical protein